MSSTKIVLGLGFGDEGKGIVTDFLVNNSTENRKLVVRFSGGQQAGHTVMTNGIKHIHSNFGSGSLRGVPTYISEYCTVYPVTLVSEYFVLKSKGIIPEIYFHPLAKITTPMDVFHNRKVSRQHGTCGLGIGSTMKRNENHYSLRIMDLLNIGLFKEKYRLIKKDYYNHLFGLFDTDEFKKYERYFFDNIKFITPDRIRDYGLLYQMDEIIFEGSQGILLDQEYGIFPNVTYAKTTAKNAQDIIEKTFLEPAQIYYVTRCYQTRHGKGWMSNNENISLINTDEEINKFNEYQEDFRIGELDYDLINYAITANEQDILDFSRNLVVTCLDQRPDFKFDPYKLSNGMSSYHESYSPDSKDFKRIF